MKIGGKLSPFAVFRALSDENRLKIVELLREGEKCACSILERLSIRQSTLSHHMGILCDCRILSFRNEGKWTYYSLNPASCAILGGYFMDMKRSALESLASDGNGSCK